MVRMRMIFHLALFCDHSRMQKQSTEHAYGLSICVDDKYRACIKINFEFCFEWSSTDFPFTFNEILNTLKTQPRFSTEPFSNMPYRSFSSNYPIAASTFFDHGKMQKLVPKSMLAATCVEGFWITHACVSKIALASASLQRQVKLCQNNVHSMTDNAFAIFLQH